MSKHSLSYTINEIKYNLKTIIYLFILIDIFLATLIPLSRLWIIIGYEVSILLGLMLGLRGQGRFKDVMYELKAIANDPRFDNNEALRGHSLKQQIRHACLEYNIWWEKQESLPPKHLKTKIKKKRKNLMEVIKRMDDRILEAIGLWLVSILAIFTLVLGEWLYLIGVSGFWILFILAAWDLTDALLLIIIIFYFKLKIEDIEPVPIGKVAVVKGEIKEIKQETILQ